MTASRLITAAPRTLAARIALAVLVVAASALALLGTERLIAQVEGERGIAPIASSGDFEVGGIAVETTGENSEEARANGWKEAQRKAWEKLWQQTHPGDKASGLDDGSIEGMVSAVVIEREQIGPRRYIATLGIIFDRARAGELLGLSGERSRSAPLLIIPVLYSGGAAAVYEYRTPWQRAWAEFKTGTSVIDYVRPHGGGGESLLLTAGQIDRRSRSWWRNILDQFGASDVIMPLARLEYQWPGGPVRGTFTARFGPDNQYLDSFTLTVRDAEQLPAMLDQAIVRLDRIYTQALFAGALSPDPSLIVQPEVNEALIAEILDRAGIIDRPLPPEPRAAATPAAEGEAPRPGATPTATATPAVPVTIQVVTPDAGAIDAGLAAVRGAPGVQGASVVSVAIGGTSVLQATTTGSLDQLRAALQARGWQVSGSGAVLSIRR